MADLQTHLGRRLGVHKVNDPLPGVALRIVPQARTARCDACIRFEGVNVEEYCVEVNFSYVYKYKEQLKLVDNNYDETKTMLTNALKDTVEKLSIIVEMIDNPHNFKRCYTIKERVYFDSRLDDKPMDLSQTFFYNGY